MALVFLGTHNEKQTLKKCMKHPNNLCAIQNIVFFILFYLVILYVQWRILYGKILVFAIHLVFATSTYKAKDLGSIPGLGRSPAEGNGYPLQYSCLENSIRKREEDDGGSNLVF